MKIFLNSTYGALLNRFCRFYDPRLGKSVTLTGRVITKHMIRYSSELMTGNYEFDRNAIIYGDSVAGSSIVILEGGKRVPIEMLFKDVRDSRGDKEYDFPNAKILTYDEDKNKSVYCDIKYIMRHKTNKKMFRVWWNNQHFIDVTEDHSLMGYLNTNNRRVGEGFITEIKPTEIGQRSKSLVHLQTVPRNNTEDRGYSKELYELMGYIMGDGNCQPKKDNGQHSGIGLSVGKQDITEVNAKIITPLQEQGWITSFHVKPNGHDIRLCGTELHDFIRDSLYTTGTKGIPIWMKQETESNICAFLRGLFSADGTVLKNGSIVRLTTVNDCLARTVQQLLYFCGIGSSYFTETTENNYEGKLSGTYSTHVSIKSRDIFKDKVGFIQERKSIAQQSITKAKKIISTLDFELAVPMKIEEIECDDYVYDIEVDHTHTFFANDLLVHNTDSVYCTLDWYMGQQKIEKTVENAVRIGYEIGDKLNSAFPQFMDDNCMIGLKRGAIIETGLEVVGRRGLFKDVKKRYAIHMVHYDGFTPKDGEDMKIMGMEVRRSDTPKFIQDFLTDVIVAVVKDSKTHEEVYAMVTDFREVFYSMDAWRRGTPCRVSKLTVNARKIRNYDKAKAEGDVDMKKPRTHFSVVGANNTNILMDHFEEHRWDIIRDGDKIEILYLRPNDFEMKSVAIKVGENYVPDWFKALPFDDARHEQKLVDRKLFNVVGGVMDWSFEPVRDFQDVLFEEVDFFAD
ncbi:MAG: hypothetical protein DRI98_11945 [Bacteroidetes bacterium]|nr:MAG: hypothetical protein DRI98_11945 [Bacteroidota bacterium]